MSLLVHKTFHDFNPDPISVSGTMTIPATTAGNTLIVCAASAANGFGGLAISDSAGDVFVHNANSFPNNTSDGPGANTVTTDIWYCLNIAGGATSISFTSGGGTPAIWVYEIGPSVVDDASDSTDDGNGSFPTFAGATLTGTGAGVFYVTVAAASAASRTNMGISSVNSPWTLDTVSPWFTYPNFDFVYGPLAAAYLDGAAGSEQAVFNSSIANAQQYCTNSIAFKGCPSKQPVSLVHLTVFPNTAGLTVTPFDITIPATAPGNTIVVCMASSEGNNLFSLDIEDDAGNSYNVGDATGGGSIIWYSESTLGPVTKLTITADITLNLWIFELTPSVHVDAQDVLFANGFDIFPNAAGPTLTGAAGDFYITCFDLGHDSNGGTQTITSVAPATWTLNTIPGDPTHPAGIDVATGVAYMSGTGVQQATATFGHNAARVAIVGMVFEGPCVAACCTIADPPNGPFDDFTELDPSLFLPCSTLRASTVAAINKNILEATLARETFPAALYHDHDIVPLPVSPVDSYPYAREELTYLWSWNNTGPESDIRLPIFSGFVYTDTAAGDGTESNPAHVPGQVHILVWRLPAGHPPEETHDGSLRVIVIGSRQAQHPEIVASNPVTPDGGGTTTDTVSGSISFPNQSAALPPTVLFTVPAGSSGLKQINYSAKIIQAATTSSSLGGTNGFQVSYADANDLQEVQTSPGPVSAGNTITTVVSGQIVVNTAESTDVAIQFGYASVGGTPMKYNLDVSWQEV